VVPPPPTSFNVIKNDGWQSPANEFECVFWKFWKDRQLKLLLSFDMRCWAPNVAVNLILGLINTEAQATCMTFFTRMIKWRLATHIIWRKKIVLSDLRHQNCNNIYVDVSNPTCQFLKQKYLGYRCCANTIHVHSIIPVTVHWLQS